MQQGYSGSRLERQGNLVKKISSDETFMHSPTRQAELIALSRKTAILPRIEAIDAQAMYMEFIDGEEGLTRRNALRAGRALRELHQLSGYAHPCMTGVGWLAELANRNLEQGGYSQRIQPTLLDEYPSDALIHSEPAQLIEKADGSIVFIDFEGIGMGSRYQDLGLIEYITARDGHPGIFTLFMQGYRTGPVRADMGKIRRMAGMIALAYAAFADFDQRMRLGLRFLGE